MAKTALGKDPSTKGDKTTRPKTHRARGGVWVDSEGYRVDGYGRRYPGQKEPYEKPKNAAKDTKTNTPPPPAPPTPDQMTQPLNQDVNNVLRNITGQVRPFDPGSSEQMANEAYQNVMNQFEADNAEAFKRQEADFYQRAAEQGIDPTSKAYGELYKQEVTDRQDRARQQASRAALAERQGVQQQNFMQQYQRFLAPGEQFGQFSPYMTQAQKNFYDMAQIQMQLGSAMDIAKLQEAGALERAKIQAKSSGGGGNQGPTLFDQWRRNNINAGYPTNTGTNPVNAGTVGVATGAGGSIVNTLTPPKKQG